MSVRAEQLAVESVQAYLRRTLPAKVSSLNGARAAVLKAAKAGPYTFGAGASLGFSAAADGFTATSVASATYTATQLASALVVSGLTFSVDSQDRLVATSTTAPSGSTRSIVALSADSTGANAVLGFSPGGETAVRAALVAPSYQGVHDGMPEVFDFGQGFWVVIQERSAEARGNIRDDTHRVTMRLEVLAAEPDGSMDRSPEYLGAAVQAVRECLLDDRTLDGAVMLTELSRVQASGKTFRFSSPGGASPLFSAADITVRVTVFERT